MIKKDILNCYKFLSHGEETEIRLIDWKKEIPPQSRFVKNEKDFIKVCEELNGEVNIYAGINERKNKGTKAEQVISVKTLVIDIDADHPLTEPANPDELLAAEKISNRIIGWFSDKNWVSPVKCFSGNGIQLWVALPEMKITNENRVRVESKIQKFYDLLKDKFETNEAKIDKIGDLARIIKVIGTKNVKGNQTPPLRTHRVSRVISSEKEFKREEDLNLKNFILSLEIEIEKEEIKETPKETPKTIEEILGNKKDLKLQALLNVTYPLEAYPSRSEAEAALITKLVWYGVDKKSAFKIMEDYCKIGKWKTAPIQYKELTWKKANKQIDDRKIASFEEMPDDSENNIDSILNVMKKVDSRVVLQDVIESEIALIGEEYSTLKKAISYFVCSGLQPTISFKVGRDYFDNRLHYLIAIESGKGKGLMKTGIRHLLKEETVYEISGPCHPEQLIGKAVYNKQGEIVFENKGYYGSKVLFRDEAINIVNETDSHSASNAALDRKAQDTFHFNLLEKKLVDNPHPLEYYPETRFMTFIHPTIILPKFFDTGSFRRFFCFGVKANERKLTDSVASILSEEDYTEKGQGKTRELRIMMRSIDSLSFTEESKKLISYWILGFNSYVNNHKAQKIRVIGDKLFFAVKNHFMKVISVLAIAKGEYTVSLETANQGCFDAVLFLLETLKYYSENSNVSLSRDIWRTEDFKKAMFLEWLHFNKAHTLKKTKVGISDSQKSIGEIFGVFDRQARAKFNEMKKEGLIQVKKSQHDSKVWLAFSPSLTRISEGNITISKEVLDFLKVESGESGNNPQEFPLYNELQSGESGNCFKEFSLSTNSIYARNIMLILIIYYIRKKDKILSADCHANHSKQVLDKEAKNGMVVAPKIEKDVEWKKEETKNDSKKEK